jgi:hypothetical protein
LKVFENLNGVQQSFSLTGFSHQLLTFDLAGFSTESLFTTMSSEQLVESLVVPTLRRFEDGDVVDHEFKRQDAFPIA